MDLYIDLDTGARNDYRQEYIANQCSSVSRMLLTPAPIMTPDKVVSDPKLHRIPLGFSSAN